MIYPINHNSIIDSSKMIKFKKSSNIDNKEKDNDQK